MNPTLAEILAAKHDTDSRLHVNEDMIVTDGGTETIRVNASIDAMMHNGVAVQRIMPYSPKKFTDLVPKKKKDEKPKGKRAKVKKARKQRLVSRRK